MRYLVLLLIFAAGAAYLTKPGEADAEAKLREEVMIGVATQDLDAAQGTGAALALAACKLRPSECYDLLRSGLTVTYTDQTLFSKVEVEGFDRKATCYGVYTRFFCPGGFKPV